MEKRIAGIIRWLERCLEAHRAGELESALMDVECARADMDILRDGFWSKLDRRRIAKRRRAFAASLVKTVLGIAAVILATAVPLALPRERPREETRMETEKEKATPAPAALHPAALEPPPVFAKANVSANDKREKRFDSRLPQVHPLRGRSPETPALRAVQSAPIAQAMPAAGRNGKRGVELSYENILALVQTGEKALKNEKPVIEVVEVIE